MDSGPAPLPADHPLMRFLNETNPYKDFAYGDYPIDLQGTPPDPIFEKLLAKVRPRLVIEVGSWKGDSAIRLATLIQEMRLDAVVLCIDTWLGSVEHLENSVKGWDIRPYRSHGYSALYHQFLANVMHQKCQDRIIPLANTSANAARWLFRKNVLADLIYLDASHEEDDVYLDLCLYWKIVRPGGILFGDDWSAYWYGVICAVNRFVKEQGLALQTANGKWFLQKPQ